MHGDSEACLHPQLCTPGLGALLRPGRPVSWYQHCLRPVLPLKNSCNAILSVSGGSVAVKARQGQIKIQLG